MRYPAALAFALLACSSSAAAPRCTPGAAQACTCPSGAAGSQECEVMGTAFGPCACSAVDAGADAVIDATPPGDVATADAPAAETGLDAASPDAEADVAAVDAPPADAADARADVAPDANPCPAGQTLCGILGEPNACVNLQRGFMSGARIVACGDCRAACSDGARCVLGRCQ